MIDGGNPQNNLVLATLVGILLLGGGYLAGNSDNLWSIHACRSQTPSPAASPISPSSSSTYTDSSPQQANTDGSPRQTIPLEVSEREVLAGHAVPRRVLERGTARGSTPRLRQFVRKLQRGEPVAVSIVGGSISQQAGCFGRGCEVWPGGFRGRGGLLVKPNPLICEGHDQVDCSVVNCTKDTPNLNHPWAPDKCNLAFMHNLMRWINATWPHAGHAMMNTARGGSRAAPFAHCARNFVAEESDLVVVEFNVNNSPSGDGTNTDLEDLVREILLLPSAPAVVLLGTYFWAREADGRRATQGHIQLVKSAREKGNGDLLRARLKGTGLIDDLEQQAALALATYYDASSLSIYSAIMPEIWHNTAGFVPVQSFTKDGIHAEHQAYLAAPLQPAVYYQWLYLLLRHLLEDEGGRSAAAHAAEDDAAAALAKLPPPLFSDPGGRYIGVRCYLTSTDSDQWRPSKNFVVANLSAPEGSGARGASTWLHSHNPTKPGFVAETLGATMHLEIDTQVFTDQSGSSGGTVWVEVHYLSSWRPNMQAAQVTCVSGCQCEGILLDGRSRVQSSVTKDEKLQVSESVQCVLAFTTVASPSDALHVEEAPGEEPLSEEQKRTLQEAKRDVFKLTSLSVLKMAA